jgi:hypothetical protein
VLYVVKTTPALYLSKEEELEGDDGQLMKCEMLSLFGQPEALLLPAVYLLQAVDDRGIATNVCQVSSEKKDMML